MLCPEQSIDRTCFCIQLPLYPSLSLSLPFSLPHPLPLSLSRSFRMPALFIGAHLWRQFIATSRSRPHSQQLISKSPNWVYTYAPWPLNPADPSPIALRVIWLRLPCSTLQLCCRYWVTCEGILLERRFVEREEGFPEVLPLSVPSQSLCPASIHTQT